MNALNGLNSLINFIVWVNKHEKPNLLTHMGSTGDYL